MKCVVDIFMDLYDNAILSGGITMFAGVGERVTPLSNSSRSALLTSAWFSTAMLLEEVDVW